jgi:asparagine synthase (glutamine-hydrolysing)
VFKFRDVCDSPNGTPLNALREVARNEGIRVILTGHGADEWLGRNHEYLANLMGTCDLRHLVSTFLHDARHGSSSESVVRAFIKQAIRPFAPASVVEMAQRVRWTMSRGDRTQPPLVPPTVGQRLAPVERLRASGRCSRLQSRAHRYIHALAPLGEGVRGTEMDDRTASTFSIEERDPFQDTRLVEFAFAIPEPVRSGAEGKHLLRKSLRGVLPESIRLRLDKAEFSSTLADALLDPVVAKGLSCPRLGSHGWIDRAAVAEKYRLFESLYRNGKSEYTNHVWDLWMPFVLETWVGMMET